MRRRESMNIVHGFADIDYQREQRCGFPEVIFAQGKTPEQVSYLINAIAKEHDVALATRVSDEQANVARQNCDDVVHVSECGILYIDRRPNGLRITGNTAAMILKEPATIDVDNDEHKQGRIMPAIAATQGNIVVCSAGTSDMAVAAEAAITARIMGSRVNLLVDIGVAGVHRALAHTDELRAANCVIAVAGMEGALPSLIAGLIAAPVIAVPTSTGYGASFGGIAALLGMLNSCASSVSVVNIDNGFGAGVIAHKINSLASGK